MVAKSPRGLGSLAVFIAIVATLQTLAMPIVFLINEGRCDWRKVRTSAALWFVQCMLIVAVIFAGVGVFRLAGSVSGGWPGDWRDAGVGALIGAAFGFLVGLGVAWLGIAERLRVNQRAAPGAAPDPARPFVRASGR